MARLKQYSDKYMRTLLVGMGALILSACSSNSSNRLESTFKNVPSYESMYLRGVFNWWEAGEQFKLSPSGNSQFSATIELIADGQPYDFKVADNKWTPSLNCGLAEVSELNIEDSLDLVCQENSLNIQFKPAQTGKFTFTLDVSDPFYPALSVTKANAI